MAKDEVTVKQPLFKKYNDKLFYMYLRENTNYLVEFSTTASPEVGGFDELTEVRAFEVLEEKNKKNETKYTIKLEDGTTYSADSVEGLFSGLYV